MALNLTALAISVAALTLSTYLSIRQTQIARRDNLALVIGEFWREFRTHDFRRSYEYVIGQLGAEHAPAAMWQLPLPARDHALDVSYFFDYLGSLVSRQALEEDVVVGVLGNIADLSWRHLEPFISGEREERARLLTANQTITEGFLVHFEDLVARSRRRPPAKVNSGLRLMTVPNPNGR